MENKFTYKVEKDKDNLVQIDIQVTPEYFKEEKEKVYNKLSKGVAITGFRPGKAPRNLIEAKLGASLYEETINVLFPKVAAEIIEKEKLSPLTQLEYHLEKVSDAEGLAFHIHFEAYQDIKLPDFKKLKVEKDKVQVEKSEVEAVVNDMFERSQQEKKTQEGKKSDKKEGKKDEKKSAAKPDDKWVESLKMEDIKTLEDLNKKVEEQLKIQKEVRAEEKYVADLVDKSVEKAGIKAPKTLVENDLARREQTYKKRIEEVGLKFEDFMKTKKISMDDLKEEWRKETEARLKREILLVEIAKLNDIKIAKEDIDKEINSIADPNLKKQYDSDTGRQYIATVMIQQKAVEWLKDQVKK